MHALVSVSYHSKLDSFADDLEKQLATGGIPPGFTTDPDTFRATVSSSSLPPGILDSAPIITYGPDNQFSMYRWKLDTEEKRAYHARLETLAWWHIDGASPVDTEDHRWEVYGTFTNTGRLVGYMTVFEFTNPLRVPRSKALRVCQCLVLPEHRRQGHGRQFVAVVTAQSEIEERGIFEVSYEDPAEDMTKIRNCSDVSRAVKAAVFESKLKVAAGALPDPLTPDELLAAQAALRIPKAQVARCFDTLCLSLVDPSSAAQYKKFRMMVKRRLHQELGMAKVEDVEQKHEALAALYQEEETRFCGVLKALGLKCSVVPTPAADPDEDL